MSLINSRVEGGIAVFELNRADAGNSLNIALLAELEEELARATARSDVDVVVLLGRGPVFCAGGDVRAMAAASDRSAFLAELAEAAHRVVKLIVGLEVPVLVGVRGAAAGAGLALTLAGDIVIAEDSARFVTAYIGIGLTPDCGTSWLLPNVVGRRVATDLLLTNRRLSAREALNVGLISRMCSDGTLETTVMDIARGLAAAPRPAARETLRLVRESSARSLEDHLDAEAAAIAQAVTTPEATTLIDAFASGAR